MYEHTPTKLPSLAPTARCTPLCRNANALFSLGWYNSSSTHTRGWVEVCTCAHSTAQPHPASVYFCSENTKIKKIDKHNKGLPAQLGPAHTVNGPGWTRHTATSTLLYGLRVIWPGREWVSSVYVSTEQNRTQNLRSVKGDATYTIDPWLKLMMQFSVRLSRDVFCRYTKEQQAGIIRNAKLNLSELYRRRREVIGRRSDIVRFQFLSKYTHLHAITLPTHPTHQKTLQSVFLNRWGAMW